MSPGAHSGRRPGGLLTAAFNISFCFWTGCSDDWCSLSITTQGSWRKLDQVPVTIRVQPLVLTPCHSVALTWSYWPLHVTAQRDIRGHRGWEGESREPQLMFLSLWQEECTKRPGHSTCEALKTLGSWTTRTTKRGENGNRVCPDEAQSHRSIPLLGINYKALIKPMVKGLYPKVYGFSVPFVRVEN